MTFQSLRLSLPKKTPSLKTFSEESQSSPISQERVSYLERKIENIASLIKRKNVLLGGGIAIAKILRCYPEETRRLFLPQEIKELNGFYREHYSIKLLCPEEEIGALATELEKAGYCLFALQFSKNKNQDPSSNLEELLKVSPTEIQESYQKERDEKKQYKQFVFVKMRSLKEKKEEKTIYFFEDEEIDSIIKVLLHSYETPEGEKLARKEGYRFCIKSNQKIIPYNRVEVICQENKIRCPFEEYEGCFLNLSSQNYIRLPHPIYMLRAKIQAYKESNATDKRHELDISILEKLIEAIEPAKSIQEILSFKPI